MDGLNLSSEQSPAKTVTGTEASNNAADQPQAEEPISSLSYQQEDKSSTNDDGAVVSTAPGAFVVQNELGKPRNFHQLSDNQFERGTS